MMMDEKGMYSQRDCEHCGQPLNAEGRRPAELYAGTYTGICTTCQDAQPYVVAYYPLDQAIKISYPPSLPAHRRDREEFTAYQECSFISILGG
jgi:hypothetical protein